MELAGVEFSILAAGPLFKFNEAISLVINCKDQDEVNYYWEALTSNGGEEGVCGWMVQRQVWFIMASCAVARKK